MREDKQGHCKIEIEEFALSTRGSQHHSGSVLAGDAYGHGCSTAPLIGPCPANDQSNDLLR